MAAQVKASRFTKLMSSLERFKTNKFLCDFTVKVGTKSLPAHRNILAASSKYFEALFLSNMKEVQDGFIDMKDVEPNAIELCIEFMYTGKAKITMTTIQDLLHSSDLLQLDDLTDLCFEELEKNISPQNSLFAIYLAQMYNRHNVKKHAEKTVINNFNAVISSPMFSSISESDLFCYIKASDASYQTNWKAVIEWTNGQEGNTDDLFPRLFALLDIQNFPIQFTLEYVLREKLVEKNETAKHLIIANMFSNVEKLRANLDISNCFIFKQLAETHQLTNLKNIKNMVRNFLAKNFEKVAEKKEFLDMSKQEFVTLIQSPEMECSETVKYEATVRWVKHGPGNIKKTFPTLFKMFKLNEFSLDYLKENVRTEPLVNAFKECIDMLMNELFSRAATARVGSTTPTPIAPAPFSTQKRRLQACAYTAAPTTFHNSQNNTSTDETQQPTITVPVAPSRAKDVVSITLDQDSFEYMQMNHSTDIDKLKEQYGVKITQQVIWDCLNISISRNNNSQRPFNLETAIDEFLKLYNFINDKGFQKTYDTSKVKFQAKLSEVIEMTSKKFTDVYVTQMVGIHSDFLLFIASEKQKCERAYKFVDTVLNDSR